MSSLKLKNSLGEWQSLPVIKGDVGNILYGTATGTNDYSVDFAVAPELIAGLVLNIKVQNANTSSTVTLNINSTGAKPIYRNGNQQLEINTIKAGQVICVIYDGVLFQLLSDLEVTSHMPISGGVLENYREKLITLTNGVIDLNTGNVFTHTPNGDITYSISNAVNGQAHSFTLIINQSATVSNLTFPISVKWQGGEMPDLSNVSKTYILTFMTVDGGTTWLGMFGGEF